MYADSGVHSAPLPGACLGLDDHQWSDEWLDLGDGSGAVSPVGPGLGLVSQRSFDSVQTNSGLISSWLPPADPASPHLHSSELQQQSSGQLGLELSPSEVEDLFSAPEDPVFYSLDKIEAELWQAAVPSTADQDACPPATAGLIAAAGPAVVVVPSLPVGQPDSSGQPGETLCSSCARLKADADELAQACLAGSMKAEDKQLLCCLLLEHPKHCRCSSGPGLYKHHDVLASSAGEVWTVTDAQPRRAEKGRKRGTGAYAWNVNWTANSPFQLPQQDEVLELLLPGFSSSSDSSASSSSSGPAPCTFYGIRASHGPVAAFGVALTGEPPSCSAGTLGGEGMWHPIRCNKKGHPLHGKQLWLFRHAFGVYRGETCVAKRKKA